MNVKNETHRMSNDCTSVPSTSNEHLNDRLFHEVRKMQTNFTPSHARVKDQFSMWK